jgi:hypothetical protein
VAALHGHWSESLALHAFGIPSAVVLLAWSFMAIQRRRLIPWRTIPVPILPGIGIALLVYWLARITAHLHGLVAFPDG